MKAARQFVLGTLCLAAAVRLSALFIERAFGHPVKSFRLEAAAMLFALVAALAFLARPRNAPTVDTVRTGADWPVSYWLGCVTAAFILYWPVLHIGFLSDDFGLIQIADRWQLGPVHAGLFRPFTLAVWAVVRQVGAGPFALHALNITAHGTVVYLTARIASAWVPGRLAALAAGLCVLLLPTSVEPVAWISGAFDVLATLLILVLVLVGRRYEPKPSMVTRVVFASIAIAALCAKEVAVVGCALVVIDAFARRRVSRPLLEDAAIVTALCVAFGVVRAMQAHDPGMFTFTKYILQRGLFQTFGGLAQPLPAAAAHAWSFGVVLGVVCLVAIVAAFVLSADRRWARTMWACLAWLLVAVSPVFARILINAELQGSRYLYLAAPAWALALVTMTYATGTRWRRISIAALAIVLGLNFWGTRVQMQAWTAAGEERDRLLQAVAQDDTARHCRTVLVSGIPESTGGAFVLQNGIPEAFEMAGLPPFRYEAEPSCRFVWSRDSRMLSAR